MRGAWGNADPRSAGTQRVSMGLVPVCGSWLTVVPDPRARHAVNWEMQLFMVQDRHPLQGSRQPRPLVDSNTADVGMQTLSLSTQ